MSPVFVVLIMRDFMGGTLPEVWGPFEDAEWAAEVAAEANGHVVWMMPAPLRDGHDVP